MVNKLSFEPSSTVKATLLWSSQFWRIKMKAITRGQALEISARVATQVNWDALDGDKAQKEIINLTPKEFGERFTAFLKNGGRVVVGEPKVITIDRTSAFDPVAFIGEGWSIVEQDERSLALTEVDLTKVSFETMLKDGEKTVVGEEKLKRLIASGDIRLDAKVFQTLWENQHLIPEAWKQPTNGNTTYVFFDGTVLRRSSGSRYVLYLCWRDGEWDWRCRWLDDVWRAARPSAVLAS